MLPVMDAPKHDISTKQQRSLPTPRTRGRGLEPFKRRFRWSLIKWILKRATERHGKARVLEVGCGEGRLLLDLMKKIPDLELHGVNKEPWKGFRDAKGIRRVARRHEYFTKDELKALPDDALPAMKFADASSLPYEDGTFDLVVSQVALPYVERRIEAIAEIYRVLRPRGMALLQLDVRFDEMPEILDREVPRIAVYDGDREVPFRAICDHWRALGFKVELRIGTKKKRRRKKHLLLKIKKTKDGPLPECVAHDPERSRALLEIRPPSEGYGSTWWGHLSAYRLVTELVRLPEKKHEKK